MTELRVMCAAAAEHEAAVPELGAATLQISFRQSNKRWRHQAATHAKQKCPAVPEDSLSMLGSAQHACHRFLMAVEQTAWSGRASVGGEKEGRPGRSKAGQWLAKPPDCAAPLIHWSMKKDTHAGSNCRY
eukprot:362120-Chlamydomonas_euryale.AAC.8